MFLTISFVWFYQAAKTAVHEISKAEALVAFQKDILFRKWATMHGGVYVPVSPTTPPNPDLAHIPERDITTPSGKHLTLLNPSYMLRQIFELSETDLDVVRGHLASLKPIRHENQPDLWEATALKAFESGAQEVAELQTIDGKPYFRFMRPFYTEPGCLKCHATQGYRQGDIRGGISVTVPVAIFSAGTRKLLIGTAGTHLILWILGIALISYTSRRLTRHYGLLQERNQMLEQEIADRRKAEELLQKKTAELNGYFERSLDLLCIADSEGHFLRLNPAWEQVLGYPLSELEGCRYLDLVHPDDVEATLAATKVLEGQKPLHAFENRYRCKDGSYRWIEWRSHPDGMFFYAAARDITEQKQNELVAKKSQALLNSLTESSTDAIYVKDTEGRYLLFNQEAERITGKPIHEVLGNDDRMLFPADEAETVMAADRKVLEAGTDTFEEVVSTTKGTRHFLSTKGPLYDENGTVIGLFGIARDITERKQLEQQLKESEQKYNILFERSSTPTVLLQLPEVVIVDVNQACEQLTGFTRQEMLGKTAVELGLTNNEERLSDISNFTHQGYITSSEKSITTRSGAERIVTSNTNRVEIGGQPYAITTLLDITERKKAETALRVNQDRLNFALQISNLGTWHLNLHDGFATRSLRHAQIFGYENNDEEWSLEKLFAHVIPDDRERVRQHIQNSITKHVDWDLECRIQRLDGELRWIYLAGGLERSTAAGAYERAYGIIQDITERKNTENEVLASKQFLQRLADNVSGLIGYWSPDLKCVFANEKYFEWFGKTSQQMIGMSVQTFMGEEMYAHSRKYLEGVLRGEPQHFEREMIKANGEAVTAWLHYIPDFIQDEFAGFFVQVTDITAVKRAQAEKYSYNSSYNRLKNWNPLVDLPEELPMTLTTSSW